MPETRAMPTRSRRAVVLVLAALLAAIGFVSGAQPASAATRPQTVVSLTFDDGNANQLAAVSALDALDLPGTFYIPSGFVGAAGYLTLPQLQAMAAAGHEIGGHTVSHPDLPSVPAAEVARQICGDRAQLAAWGFDVRSFAYPFASSNAAVEQQAEDCGYNSARLLGDLRSPSGCSGCPAVESIPPLDPYATRALAQVETSWTLAQLKAAVTRAELTGGWVQFTFHNVCASGCDISVTPTVFNQFATWLDAREVTRNTVVRTVGDVVGGATRPVVAAPGGQPPAAGVNAVQNPGLETLVGGAPSCWMQGGYGSNTAVLDTVSPGRTGATAARVRMSNHVDGDAKWLPQFDLGSCSPAVAAGSSYALSTWYTSTTVTQYAVYLRTTGGAWQYWTSSPWFGATTAFTEAAWQTPPIPAGYSGISFGLNLFSNGTLVTDDASMLLVAPSAAARQAPSAPPSGPVEVYNETEADLVGQTGG